MSEPKHFNLTGQKGGGLSPSQMLDAIENGVAVEPVEETTNLRYIGASTPIADTEVEDDAQVEMDEVRPTPIPEDGIRVADVEPPFSGVQIGKVKPITSTAQLTTMGASMAVEEACAIVYRCLPVPNQKAIDDVMVNIKLTLPQFMLGVLNAAYAAGNYSSPLLDPSWASPDSSYLITDLVCGECGVKFSPKYRGQKFCSNPCGIAFHAREDRERKEKARLAKLAENKLRMKAMESF